MKNMLMTAVAAGALVSALAMAAGSPAPKADPNAPKPIVGDAQAGAQKAGTCVACHGANGISANPEWPVLAGQNEAYTHKQLRLFKSGVRQNALMNGIAAGLSEQDMADLGAYYATQPGRIGSADPALVEQGEALWRVGHGESGVAACIACHGPRGEGNALAAFPMLSGQHATYLAAQLKAYRSGERATPRDTHSLMMQGVARGMTDAQIEAVSSYAEGLN